MIINYNTKTIQIKIVYFGPAMSGKTTSLKYIMSKFNSEQNLRSIETSTGRTLVFDFGCLNISGKEWSLKILLLSATGQDFYTSTRPATIEMVDGLIFIADSQRIFLDDNKRSWNELSLYFGDKIYDIPIIVCLNKQDMGDVLGIEEIKQEFRLTEFKKYEITNTIAKDGVGVTESFQKLLQNLFPTLSICQM